MRGLDFSSWQGLLTTLAGLALITVIGVGIRLLVMQTVQERRARENRQINERLRTLIAAYKVLGGSFTGDLDVDPTHLRELRQRAREEGLDSADDGNDRARRIRDAVEAALSDVILLGTDEQVRLAAQAATDLAAGRPIHTAALVVSLRDFIRSVLDLGPVPSSLAIPRQGPARPSASKGRSDGAKGEGRKGSGGAGMGAATGRGAASGRAQPPRLPPPLPSPLPLPLPAQLRSGMDRGSGRCQPLAPMLPGASRASPPRPRQPPRSSPPGSAAAAIPGSTTAASVSARALRRPVFASLFTAMAASPSIAPHQRRRPWMEC